MQRAALAFSLSLALFAACGGGTKPADGPKGDASAAPTAEPTAAPKADPKPDPEPAATAAPTAAASAKPADDAGKAKDRCADLKKGRCKITTGCAWGDDDKCKVDKAGL